MSIPHWKSLNQTSQQVYPNILGSFWSFIKFVLSLHSLSVLSVEAHKFSKNVKATSKF